MKLLHYEAAYPDYLERFYAKNLGLADKTYADQSERIAHDSVGWTGVWAHWLGPLGYQVMDVIANAEPLQRAWARDHGLRDWRRLSLSEIAFAQIKHFAPDVLWFNNYDTGFLQRLRTEVPSIKLVLGWVGSAIPKTDAWRHMDLVLSCAPESVENLARMGVPTRHMDHGFDPRINERLNRREKTINVSFIGQIVRGKEYHLYREEVLERIIARRKDFQVFSPSFDYGLKEELLTLVKLGAFGIVAGLRRVGTQEEAIRQIPVINRAASWACAPMRPVHPKIKRFLRPGVFGLDMFQAIRDSRITLNIHADSSPTHASNMRLFETTGVGTCLLSDWRDNLASLFEPDREIVTYRSAEECVAKINWLLDHPAECVAIAKAGQMRCLRDHSFANRAVEVDEIIKRQLLQATR